MIWLVIIVLAFGSLMQSFTIVRQGRTIRKMSKSFDETMHKMASAFITMTERTVDQEFRLRELERKWS